MHELILNGFFFDFSFIYSIEYSNDLLFELLKAYT